MVAERRFVRRENVEITFFNYRPDSDVVQLCRGMGVWRAHLLSAFYYDPDPQNTESGVFVLRLSGKRLKGTYAQYGVDSDEQLALGMETFELRRVRLPMIQQVRLAIGKRPVKTYADARALYDSVLQSSARVAGANAVAR